MPDSILDRFTSIGWPPVAADAVRGPAPGMCTDVKARMRNMWS